MNQSDFSEADIQRLRSLPMSACMEYWDQAEKASGKLFLQMVRSLALADLFYLLVRVCNRIDLVHPWKFDRVREVEASPYGHLDLWAREHCKDLANDTPMLTANRGWSTHGELKVGDIVFSPEGKQITVLALSKRYTTSKCYRITFSDGSSIVCGAGHQWRIRQKIKHRIANSNKRHIEFVDYILSTDEMINEGGRLDVGTTLPLQFPERELPISPYLLGCWLGDGNLSGPVVTMLWEDAQPMLRELEAHGHTWIASKTNSRALSYRIDARDRAVCLRGHDKSNPYRHACRTCKKQHAEGKLDPIILNGFSQRLKKLDLLGAHKHIPEEYLTASVEQRMDLLRGLMDTDGTCNTRGTATFANINERLAFQVYELAGSLALQPHIRSHFATIDSSKSVNGLYKSWQVSFQAHKERNPFKIKRKADRAIAQSNYYGNRTVTHIEQIESVPTRCIQVEGGMYAAGKEFIPTHNSSIITFGLSIWDVLRDPEITIGIFSHTRPIAKAFLRQIMREFETNQLMQQAFPDVLWGNDVRKAPKWNEDDGIIIKRKGNPNEATIEAWGLVDAQPTSKHFKRLHYDDIVVQASVTTPEMIEKTMTATEQSYNLGTVDGVKSGAGTRWHFNDPYRTIIDRGTLKLREHPGRVGGTEEGKSVLWSNKIHEQKRRDMGPYTYAAQILLNPKADALMGFKREWLRSYTNKPSKTNNYLLVDAASSKKKGSDYTSMHIVGLGTDGNYYILDMVRDRLNLAERLERVFTLHRKYKPKQVRYERYGMMADIEALKARMEQENYRFDILEVGGITSKQDRIRRLLPMFEQGKVYLPKSLHVADWQKIPVDLVHAFIEEEYYPFPVGLHDDMLDSLARIAEPDLKLTWPMEKKEEPPPVQYDNAPQTGWMLA